MRSYRRIGAVKISAEILRFLGQQLAPVTGKEIAQALDIKYDTVMCHLATLEDVRFAERKGGGDSFALGGEAAMLWTRRVAHLKAEKNRADAELERMEAI